MKYTLLDMVQNILATSVDGDPVNSIGDTVESEQIAEIVKNCYFNLTIRHQWGYRKKLFQLIPSSDGNYPTHMSLPSDLSELIYINYNVTRGLLDTPHYTEIKHQYPDEFLRRQNHLNTASNNVERIKDKSGVDLLIVTNKSPTYWTSFDDKNIVFDSYNKEIEDTLVATKTQCYGLFTPEWIHEDSFIPHIKEDCFPLLLSESKNAASYLLKQTPDAIAMQEATKQSRYLSKHRNKNHNESRYPDYGRHRK